MQLTTPAETVVSNLMEGLRSSGLAQVGIAAGQPSVEHLLKTSIGFFGVMRNEVGHAIDIAPIGSKASDMLTQSHARTTNILLATARAADELKSGARIDGFALAGRDDAHVAWSMLQKSMGGRTTWPTSTADLQRRWMDAAVDLPTAENFDGWITTGVDLSDAIVRPQSAGASRAMVDTRVADTMLHEAMHTKPTDNRLLGPVYQNLEEGIATTLARWPGELERFAASARLAPFDRASVGPLPPAYELGERVVRNSTRLAGIDATNPKSYEAAVSLLRHSDLVSVPARLEQSIHAASGDRELARHAKQFLEGQSQDVPLPVLEQMLR